MLTAFKWYSLDQRILQANLDSNNSRSIYYVIEANSHYTEKLYMHFAIEKSPLKMTDLLVHNPLRKKIYLNQNSKHLKIIYCCVLRLSIPMWYLCLKYNFAQ